MQVYSITTLLREELDNTESASSKYICVHSTTVVSSKLGLVAKGKTNLVSSGYWGCFSRDDTAKAWN